VDGHEGNNVGLAWGEEVETKVCIASD